MKPPIFTVLVTPLAQPVVKCSTLILIEPRWFTKLLLNDAKWNIPNPDFRNRSIGNYPFLSDQGQPTAIDLDLLMHHILPSASYSPMEASIDWWDRELAWLCLCSWRPRQSRTMWDLELMWEAFEADGMQGTLQVVASRQNGTCPSSKLGDTDQCILSTAGRIQTDCIGNISKCQSCTVLTSIVGRPRLWESSKGNHLRLL